jgi:hypothetical protein
MDNQRDRVLASLIIIVPLFLFGPGDAQQGQIYGLLLGCFVYLALSLPNKVLGVFMLYVAAYFAYFLSSVFARTLIPEVAGVAIDAILFLMIGAIIYTGIANCKKKNIKWFINAVCIAALIQAVLATLQSTDVNPVVALLSNVVNIDAPKGGMNINSPVGTLMNTNYLSIFVAVSVPLFFRKWWKFFIPVLLYAIFVSKCRTAILSLFAGCIYFAWYHRSRWSVIDKIERFPWITSFVPLIIFAFIVIATRSSNLSVIERYNDYWVPVYQILSGHWQFMVFGVGPGITLTVNNHIHSSYFGIAFSYGLIGIAYLAAFVWTINKKHPLLTMSLVIILTDMTLNHFWTIPTTGLEGLFILGLVERMKDEEWLA